MHKGKFLYTDYYISRDGINFKDPENNRIWDGNCLSHNFHVFIGIDGFYYGIGGMHSWKNQKQWHDVKNFDEFKKLFIDEFGREYTRDEKRFAHADARLKNEIWILDYSDGLYLFKSADGIKWRKGKKIITPKSTGFHSSLAWKASEFDGHICCIHDGKQYYLYLRDNVKKGTRFIQYATSKDLIEWSEFKSIKINPEFNEDVDNYYYASIFYHNEMFYGVFPYYSKDKACLRLMASENGFEFHLFQDEFVTKPIEIEGQLKNPCQPVNGIVKRKNELYFFVHHNYFGHDKK